MSHLPHLRHARPLLATLSLLSLGLSLGPATAGCRGDYSEDPPIHPNPNMDDQPRLDPQEPSSFFSDRRAMRKPVPGTVARGHLRTDTKLYEGRHQGRFAHRLPDAVPANRATFERGRERFNVYCAPCHGPAGYGDGVVHQRKAGLPQPASFHDERLRAMELGELVHTVTRGKGSMQKMDRIIPARDRWAIAAYVRALQLSQGAPDPRPEPKEVQP